MQLRVQKRARIGQKIVHVRLRELAMESTDRYTKRAESKLKRRVASSKMEICLVCKKKRRQMLFITSNYANEPCMA